MLALFPFDQEVPLYSSVVATLAVTYPNAHTAAVCEPKPLTTLREVFKLFPSVHDDPSYSSELAVLDGPGVAPPATSPAVWVPADIKSYLPVPKFPPAAQAAPVVVSIDNVNSSVAVW